MKFNLINSEFSTDFKPKSNIVSTEATPSKFRSINHIKSHDESLVIDDTKQEKAIDYCSTPKDSQIQFHSHRKHMSGSLTNRGGASKGKEEAQSGGLQIEYPDGRIEYLEIDFQGIEAWLKSSDDHNQLLEFLRQWETNNNDYISDFTHDFGAITNYDDAFEEEEEDEQAGKKKKAQPGNFEFDDDDEDSVEGVEVDFDAMMKLKKKNAKLLQNSETSVRTRTSSVMSEKPDIKDLFYKILECCLPKAGLDHIKGKTPR